MKQIKTTCMTALLIVVAFVFHVEAKVNTKNEQSETGKKFIERVETALKKMKKTEYQHTTAIDEEKKSFCCDCSGLVCYFLRNYFPEAYVSLKGNEAHWRKRPLSVTFHETFVSAGVEDNGEGGWRQIKKITDVKAGDVLAWRKPQIVKGSTTGHTLIIGGEPVIEKNGRVKIRVIDSTRSIHANDSRPKGTNGVGAGDMWFVVNEEGEATGFYVNEKSRLSTKNSVAIGRLVGKSNDKHVQTKDKEYIGLRKMAAQKLAEKNKLKWRVIVEDDKISPVPLKFDQNRLNFVIKKGRVIRVRRG